MTGFAAVDPWSTAQLVGYAAMVVSISAYALKRDAHFKVGIGASLLTWTVHYVLLGAWTTAFTCLLIASRQVLALLAPALSPAARKCSALGYAAAFTGVLAWTWAGPLSLLPWLAALNATYAYIYLAGARLRAQVMLSTSCWLVNALLLGSIGNVVTNLATLAMSAWAIRRLRRTAEPA